MKLENLSKELRNELCSAFQLQATASDEQIIQKYNGYRDQIGMSPDVDLVPIVLLNGYENAKTTNNLFKLNAARDALALYIIICDDRIHVGFEKFVIWFVVNYLSFALTQTSQLKDVALTDNMRAQLGPIIEIVKAIHKSLAALEFAEQKQVPTTQLYATENQVQDINAEINKLYVQYTNSDNFAEKHILRRCLLMLNRVVLSLKSKQPNVYSGLDSQDCNARLIELVNADMANRKLLVGTSSQSYGATSTSISIGRSTQTFMPAPSTTTSTATATDTTPLIRDRDSEQRSNNRPSQKICCHLL